MSEWKDKYEESRREVIEMRSVVMLGLPGYLGNVYLWFDNS